MTQRIELQVEISADSEYEVTHELRIGASRDLALPELGSLTQINLFLFEIGHEEQMADIRDIALISPTDVRIYLTLKLPFGGRRAAQEAADELQQHGWTLIEY